MQAKRSNEEILNNVRRKQRNLENLILKNKIEPPLNRSRNYDNLRIRRALRKALDKFRPGFYFEISPKEIMEYLATELGGVLSAKGKYIFIEISDKDYPTVMSCGSRFFVKTYNEQRDWG